MSLPWNTSTGYFDEFLVSVNLFLSADSSARLRKAPPPLKKKVDKRDGKFALNIEDGKKLKEQSSWMLPPRGSTAGGQWRAAMCKLTEVKTDGSDRCMLNIYLDETVLFQTVYIHLLNHTDIQPTDTSLFGKKNCIGIHAATRQNWTARQTNEPIFIQFQDSTTCTAWLSLLRSYAVLEIYGRWSYPKDGGAYRLWRQVNLTIHQARSLGQTKAFKDSTNVRRVESPDSEPEIGSSDIDVFCEIYLNGAIFGRTTPKQKSLGSPDWHESFLFPDLPPFDYLDVVVWQEKKLMRPAVMGKVRVPLMQFPRAEVVDGWYPILFAGPVAGDLHIGDIRLKIKVDEEIILPAKSYQPLTKLLKQANFLDVMSDAESKWGIKTLSQQFMLIAMANNRLVESVVEVADREVDVTPSSKQTLFRGNSNFTKTVESCMAFYGKPFLEASIGPVLRRLCTEAITIEVDPGRSTSKSTKDIEKNMDQLNYWCGEIWTSIYTQRQECPNEMRLLFGKIRKSVEKRYPPMTDTSKDLRWQSVSAFCFLRFIVPAILHPHLFGLHPGLPPPLVQRSLTLIAKVIQSLANLNPSSVREEFMRGMLDFLRRQTDSMVDYLKVVSTPMDEAPAPRLPVGLTSDRYEVENLSQALVQRTSTMPNLDREALQLLPHPIDIPRHLATTVSVILRHTTEYRQSRKTSGIAAEPNARDQFLDELCSRCYAVEEEAIKRVKRLAQFTIPSQPTSPLAVRPPASPMADVTDTALPTVPRRRKSSRPSTAPSSSESDLARNENLNMMPPPPGQADDILREHSALRNGLKRGHNPKSTSTDSIPSYHVGDTSSSNLRLRTVISHSATSEDVTKRKRGILKGLLRR